MRYLWLVFLFLIAGCDSGGPSAREVAANGKLLLKVADQEVVVPIKGMDIFLVDPDSGSEQPETFLVHGEGTELAGTFPKNLKVGYEEELTKLVGQTIQIQASSEPGGQSTKSRLNLNGESVRLKGGTLTFVKYLGDNPDGAGGALEASVALDREDGGRLEGRLLILAKTWG